MAQRLPAIVKLALLGSNPDDSAILDEQLHSFRYDVIKSEAGGSYTYTIELINYDERFIEGIIRMYSLLQGDVTTPTSIKSFTAANTVAGGKGSITFPKLLIQWGYPEAMSGVHVAQISNVSYKFTQAKEKILVITAVDISEMYKEYTSNTVSTVPRNISMSITESEDRADTTSYRVGHPTTKGLRIANHLGEPLPFSRIIQDVIGDLVASMPTGQYTPLASGDLTSFSEDTSAFFERVIASLVRGHLPSSVGDEPITNNVLRANKIFEKEFYGFYIQAIKRLFTYFGIELVENDFENMGTGYISISQEKELENGVFGTTTNVISKDQISSTQYDKVFKSQEKVAFELPVEFDRDSGNPVIVDILEYEARLYATSVLDHPWTDDLPGGLMQNVYLTLQVPNSDLELFRKDPPEGTAYKSNAVFTVRNFNYEGKGYPIYKKSLNLGSAYLDGQYGLLSLLANNKTRVPDGEPEQQLGHILQEHQTRLEKLNRDMYEEGLSGVLSTPGPLSGITVTEKKFSDLTGQEKADLEYNNLQYFIDSPQGVPVTTTIRSIIDKYNNLVGYPELKIDVMVESIRHDGSFEEVLQRMFDDTTEVPTTVFYMGLQSAISKLSQNTLPPIFSTLSDSKTATMLRLDYGGENANVKYFDFASDNRYLANLLAAQVSMNTFKTFENYLSFKSMTKTLVPVFQILAEYLEKSRGSMTTYNPFEPNNTQTISNVYAGYLTDAYFTLNPMRSPENQAEIESNFLADTLNPPRFGDSPKYTPHYDSDAVEKTKQIEIFVEGSQTMLNGTPADIEVHQQFWDSLDSQSVVELVDYILKNRITAIDEEGALALNIFHKALSNPLYVALLFSKERTKRFINKQDINSRVSLITDALGVSGYTALEQISPTPFVHSILTKNPFDISLKNTLANDVNLSLDFYLKNITSMFEIKVKSLGIPEMDTYREISAPRLIDFNVEDIHNTFVADDYNHNTHWLSGIYHPLALSHQIDVKGGYTTEFKLIKFDGVNI